MRAGNKPCVWCFGLAMFMRVVFMGLAFMRLAFMGEFGRGFHRGVPIGFRLWRGF